MKVKLHSYTGRTKTSVTKKYGRYRMVIQTFFINKCVCYLTAFKTLHLFHRSKHCLVVTTILNKQTIRNKTKPNNNMFPA